MLPRDYADVNCSIARTMEVLGDRWTLLIIRNALVGMTQFDQHLRVLGLARNVLTDRLNRLVEENLLERRAYQQRPVRHEYLPTDKARDVWPVLAAMVAWGDRYHAPDGPPRLLVHRDCGGPLEARLVCADCGQAASPDQVDTRPGPGTKPNALPDFVSGSARIS